MNIDVTNSSGDLWDLVERLIHNTIVNKVNTVLPAEVVEIDTNAQRGRASVRSLVMPYGAKVPAVIFHDIPVLQPAGKRYRITQPVTVGDRGLLLTCKLDISKLKVSDDPQVAQYPRVYDRNDSVFLPLTFASPALNDETQERLRVEYLGSDGNPQSAVTLGEGLVEITSTNGVKVQADGGAGVLVKADRVTLECDKLSCAPLADALKAVQDLMDKLAQGMVGSGTNNTAYMAAKPLHMETFKKVGIGGAPEVPTE